MTTETYGSWTITRGRIYKSTTGRRGVVYYATDGLVELTSHVSIDHIKKMVDLLDTPTLDSEMVWETIRTMSQEGQ